MSVEDPPYARASSEAGRVGGAGMTDDAKSDYRSVKRAAESNLEGPLSNA